GARSAPAPRTPDRAWQRSWCGAGVSSRGRSWLRRRRRLRRTLTSGALDRRRVRSRLGLAGFRQLHGPVGGLSGVDLEKAGAIEAARQAVLGSANAEFLLARAHESLARPFAATIVVDRIDIIVA